MKRTVIGIILGAFLTLTVGSYAESYFQFVQSANTLYINDKKIEMPLYNYNYTNHAPIRAVAEAVGLDVNVTGTRIDFTSKSLETVARNVKNSCVMIYAYTDKTVRYGSGWVYNSNTNDTYIITAKHVVENTNKINLFLDDSAYSVSGTIHYLDPLLDIAVIKADTKLPSVALGDSGKLTEGEKLVSVTSPKGAKNVLEECSYSGLNGYQSGRLLTITDNSMTGGSSGGAIFNFDSEIVGMAIEGVDGTEIMGAIPINDLKPILEKLK